MHGLNAIGNPLVDIKNTMSRRIDGFNTEIDRIHQESNLIVRFFLKLEFLFKYGKFPPTTNNAATDLDAIPLYDCIIRNIRNAPSNGNGCIKIKDNHSTYDLVYLKCTNMWSVEQHPISNGSISGDIPNPNTITITHQEMLNFMGVKQSHIISASNYSANITDIKQSFKDNQGILNSILEGNSQLNGYFRGLLCRSEELNKYCPERGHKFTVGDVCGSPVTMLLAGYASGTLKMKHSQSETDFLTGFMLKYKKLIYDWEKTPADRVQMAKLASELMAELQPVVSGPLASNEHSGLLFLGDNINDRMDSDYETLARVISFLSSAGAEFLRGNHDSFVSDNSYHYAQSGYDKQIVVQLRNFFLPALYVPETNTLYTHNGVILDDAKTKVLYAFPKKTDDMKLDDKQGNYGEQICKYITENITYYDDNTSSEDWNVPEIMNKTPTNFRPEMEDLEFCAKHLNIKQVAGHAGEGLQLESNAIRINGLKLIGGKSCAVPIATITGK